MHSSDLVVLDTQIPSGSAVPSHVALIRGLRDLRPDFSLPILTFRYKAEYA
jgi:hypothetical protein